MESNRVNWSSGSGQIAKMINQICIAGLVQALSEAMAFWKKADVDMEKVLSVISRGAANLGRWKIDTNNVRWKI